MRIRFPFFVAFLILVATGSAPADEGQMRCDTTIHWRPAAPGVFGDPNPFFWKDEYHVFYLLPDGHSYAWEHIVSKDLVRWRQLPRALDAGRKGEPDEWNAASGSIVEQDGTFHKVRAQQPAAPPRPSGSVTSDASREWAMGPFVKLDKPVLSPNPEAKFQCPLAGTTVLWEGQNVYNPAVVVKDGKVYLLYRADDKCWWKFNNEDQATSRIGLAWSEDGRRFTRHPTPVVFPDNDAFTKYEWPGGCQDVHVVEGEDSVYYMNYTAWGEGGMDSMCVATSKDLIHWQKHGPAFAKFAPGAVRGSRSGVVVTRQVGEKLLPVKINGHYLMYYTHPSTLAVSDNLIDWKPLGKSVWPGGQHESGAIALWRDDGILLMFNGQDLWNLPLPKGTWALGQALIDRANLTTVLRHQEGPFLQPEFDWEKKGFCPVPATVANGLVYFKGEWLLYYGAADRHVGLAVFKPKNDRRTSR